MLFRAALPRTVVVLGLVSLLNDAASEMITPLIPLILTGSLGAGPIVVGLVEGLADAAASILKLYSGRAADRWGHHKGMVIGGYGLSNAARPLIGLALSWPWVLALRFTDRIGKGVRSAPRDDLISTAVDAADRGKAFGFHRSMDHAGAMLGPLIAFALLALGLAIQQVMLFSVIPGLLLLGVLGLGLKIPPRPVHDQAPRQPLSWKRLDRRLRILVLTAGGMALAAAPDVLLILWASERGVPDLTIPLLWAAAHAVRSIVSGGGGLLADHYGRLPIVVVGWSARVVMLLMLAFVPGRGMVVWALFLAYAATTAFTEGAERAFIGDHAPQGQTATAFGLYHMVAGLLALLGALLFGSLWQWFDVRYALVTAAALTMVFATALVVLTRRATPTRPPTA
jgi:MFS family permease